MQRDDVILSLSGLELTYGKRRILDGVDLCLHQGEMLCLMGASGCGKTTTLRCINLLEEPDSGTIRFDGRTVFHRTSIGEKARLQVTLPKYRKNIGVVFQAFNLFPNRTVLDNVAEGLLVVLGQTKKQARRAAMELLERVGLKTLSGEYPHTLSGGERQRVAIVRAIAMKPKLLLLDEVTSALDPPRAASVLELVKELKHDTGLAMVLVTHQVAFAERAADTVAFMDGGKVITVGAPTDVIGSPSNKVIRRFVRAAVEIR